jgi:streptogramin lyase
MVAFIGDDGTLASSFAFPTAQEIDPYAIKVAADGDVIVAGASSLKPWVSKLSSSGVPAWSTSGSSSYSGYVADLALSADGSVSILAVDTTNVWAAMPMYVKRLDANGQLVWSQLVGNGYGGCLTLGQDGTLYVAAQGDTKPASTNVVVAYAADGIELRRWAVTDSEYPHGIASATNGLFVLAGNLGTRKLSQFDPNTGKVLGTLTVSDGALAFAMIDPFNAAVGSYQVDDIGLQWFTIPTR